MYTSAYMRVTVNKIIVSRYSINVFMLYTISDIVFNTKFYKTISVILK